MDHLCSAYAMGKGKKQSHKPKSEDTNQEKLYLLHMDLCEPMRVASVNGKKYILIIVDDYSRYFQPVFDEFFSPPAIVASSVPVEEAPAPVESTGLPSSKTVNQDAPSLSTSQTTPQSQSQTIPLCAEEESHDLELLPYAATMFNILDQSISTSEVENGVVELYFVRTEYQLADIFTKALCRERIKFLIDKLGMRSFTLETLKELADEAEE
ncbi:retrovirus-related pol polyprotein from transposon TNT 1-94 [Tanacetum coccineum]